MKIRKTLTALYQNLAYIGIALTGCAMIGLLIFLFSVRELNETAESTERTQLLLAANDLENQMDILEDISESVSSTIYYQPEYFGATTYREIELLNHFAQFRSHSVLCKDYFLYYTDSGYFYSKEAKMPFDTYFQMPFNNYLSDDSQTAELRSYMESLSISDQGVVFGMEQDHFLILYPLRLKHNTQLPTAVMGFVLNRQDLLDRVTVSSGKIIESLSIYYQQQPLVQAHALSFEDFAWQENTFVSDDYIAARSDVGIVVLADSIPAGGWYSGLDTYRTVISTFLLLSLLLLFALVILVVRKQHAPIQRMSEKVQSMFPESGTNAGNPNQLKQIEHAFDMIHQQNLLSQEQIEEQIDLLNNRTTALKQQVLLLVLRGSDYRYISPQLEELNISLAGPFFRVFVLNFKSPASPEVLHSIENLSDKEQYYYTLHLQDNLVVVICSFLLEATAQEAGDLLDAISTSQEEAAFSIASGLTVSSFDKIPLSYYSVEATDHAPDPSAPQSCTADSDTSWYRDHSLQLMLGAIRDRSRSNAFAYLDQLIGIVGKQYPSALLQRIIMADIVSKLLQTAYDLEVPIPPEEAGALSIYSNLQGAHRDLQTLLGRMFCKLDQQQEQYENDLSLRIKRYIDEHALEYSCSLNRIAEVFNLPPKQINHYIRLATNQTYKEYELNIRMKKAYELLTQTNLSVMQISEKIGYMDVSSFIKAFKNASGTTPGAFRKNAGHTDLP